MEITTWKRGDKPIDDDFVGLMQMSAADYHSDPCESPTLSSSIACHMVQSSAFHGWLHHPRLGGLPVEQTKAMIRGSIIHSLLAGEDPGVVLIDANDFRTKAAQSARDSALAEGKLPYLLADYREAEVLVESVQDQLRKEGVDLAGHHELAAFWNEEVDGRKVHCRALLDHTNPPEGMIHDFKTCNSAHPDSLSRAICDHGYDIQWAAYTSALGQIMDLGGRVDFAWVFIEELPEGSPVRCVVQVVRPSGLMREFGKTRWQSAVKMWHECLTSGDWPVYRTGPSMIDPPPWQVKQALGRE